VQLPIISVYVIEQTLLKFILAELFANYCLIHFYRIRVVDNNKRFKKLGHFDSYADFTFGYFFDLRDDEMDVRFVF
jgi:hypothetical protein